MTTPTPSPRATRAVVADAPGAPATLTLYDDNGALGSLVLGPADALALACDLLATARIRYGPAAIRARELRATPDQSLPSTETQP